MCGPDSDYNQEDTDNKHQQGENRSVTVNSESYQENGKKVPDNKNSESKILKCFCSCWMWIKGQIKLTDLVIAVATVVLAYAAIQEHDISVKQHDISKKQREISEGQKTILDEQKNILKQTDETTRLRDRAFVYFSPNFRLYPDPKNPVVWAIEIFFENFGAMPARKILIKYKCIILDKEVSDPFNLGEWKRAEVGTVIGPKQPGGFLAHQGDFKEVGLIKQGKLIVYVVARIEYRDGFDFKTIRVTEISRKLNVDPYNGHSFYLAGPHNCSDEDCH